VSKPVVSSILSRHTGHVGNSTSEGVGGARGLVERDDAKESGSAAGETVEGNGAVGSLDAAGVKGSLMRSG
jgi:hypothetical protein